MKQRQSIQKIYTCFVLSVGLLMMLFTASAHAQATDLSQQSTSGSVELSLEEAIQIALEQNLDIQVEHYNPEIAQENIYNAEAAFAPTFSANSGYSRNESDNTNTPLNAVSADAGLTQQFKTGASYNLNLNTSMSDYAAEDADTAYSNSLSLTFTQPLLKNRGIEVNTIKIVTAEKNREISVSTLRAQVSDIIAAVAEAYWSLIENRGILEADQYALQLAYDLVKSNEAQVNVGTLAPEVLQAQATAASREVQIISDEQQVRNQEDELRRLLNIPEDDSLWQAELIPTTELVVESPQLSLEESIQVALKNREEIARQNITLDIQNLALTSAQNTLLPEINVQATAGLTGSDEDFGQALGDLLGFETYNAGISVNFSYPPGNKSAQSEYQQAKLTYDQAVLSLQNLEQQIAAQVRQAVRGVETSYKQIEASKIALQLAERQLSAEQKKFNEGLSTNFTVLNYQEELASAQSNYTSSIVKYKNALVSLD